MLYRAIVLLGILVMVSCQPAFSSEKPLIMTEKNCSTIKVMARQIIIDLQQGMSQYQAMRALNKRPMTDFGKDGEVVKVYLQVNLSAFSRNLNRGFRVLQILPAVEQDCLSQVGS